MRIGMGLVGPGFVGAHHVDAVRRLGYVDVVAVAAGIFVPWMMGDWTALTALGVMLAAWLAASTLMQAVRQQDDQLTEQFEATIQGRCELGLSRERRRILKRRRVNLSVN